VTRSRGLFASGVTAVVAGGLMFAATCTSPGDSCRSDSDCRGDLVCARPAVDGGPAETGACTHKAAGPGEFCRVVDDCAEGLFCSNELPSPVKRLDGSCVPLREDGQRCANADQCRAPLDCLLTAEEDGTCGAPPTSDASAEAGVDSDAGTDANTGG
jgi:hypothetical protein